MAVHSIYYVFNEYELGLTFSLNTFTPLQKLIQFAQNTTRKCGYASNGEARTLGG